MLAENLLAVHQTVVEIFQSGPQQLTDTAVRTAWLEKPISAGDEAKQQLLAFLKEFEKSKLS